MDENNNCGDHYAFIRSDKKQQNYLEKSVQMPVDYIGNNHISKK